MKVITMFHQDKASGLGEFGDLVASNPSLTPKGSVQSVELAKLVQNFVPFASCYCSRLARTAGTLSAVCLALDMDFQSIKELGQHASKDGDAIYTYPGFEGQAFVQWQEDGVRALRRIRSWHDEGDTVLVCSHRPVLAGVACHTRGITDASKIRELANNPDFSGKGYVIFDVTVDGEITWTY